MMSARAVLAGLKSLPRQHLGLRTASTSTTRDMPEVSFIVASFGLAWQCVRTAVCGASFVVQQLG